MHIHTYIHDNYILTYLLVVEIDKNREGKNHFYSGVFILIHIFSFSFFLFFPPKGNYFIL
jgi:hypothetical protein